LECDLPWPAPQHSGLVRAPGLMTHRVQSSVRPPEPEPKPKWCKAGLALFLILYNEHPYPYPFGQVHSHSFLPITTTYQGDSLPEETPPMSQSFSPSRSQPTLSRSVMSTISRLFATPMADTLTESRPMPDVPLIEFPPSRRRLAVSYPPLSSDLLCYMLTLGAQESTSELKTMVHRDSGSSYRPTSRPAVVEVVEM
jgi:hypothetical protein